MAISVPTEVATQNFQQIQTIQAALVKSSNFKTKPIQ